MKQVQSSFSAREDRESSFHLCGTAVRLLHACLCAERPDNALLTCEEVLRSTCTPV